MSEGDTLVPPRERECERCGRHDVWDDDADHWEVTHPGRVHCIHEWDINGTYNPFAPE